MDHPETITVLSLCSGYGGLELGLARALANPLRVVGVEIEAYALALLEAKAAEGSLAIEALWPDLRTFPAERFRGCFDFVLAGYPCQPFSVAGLRGGSKDARHLWPDIRRIIGELSPDLVFLENVHGHLSLGFDEVLLDLEKMDFLVATGLFSAMEAGLSIEHGKRLFVLGQASGRGGQQVFRLSEGSGRSVQTETDVGRPSEVLGSADGERLSSVGRQSQEAFDGRSLRVAPQGVGQYEWEAKRYVEPGLGQTADGPSRRVDRLRLIGNGVAPAQAELAFRALWDMLIQGKD